MGSIISIYVYNMMIYNQLTLDCELLRINKSRKISNNNNNTECSSSVHVIHWSELLHKVRNLVY